MSNPYFNPQYSTWDIWRAAEQTQCLDDDLIAIEADIASLESSKADTNHTHSGTTSSAGGHSHHIRYGSYGTSGGGYIVLRRWVSDDAYTGTNDATNTAGAHTHTMTTGNNSANHTHRVTAKGSNSSTSVTPAGTNSNTGSGSAHNNLPPYYTVYMWHRTA